MAILRSSVLATAAVIFAACCLPTGYAEPPGIQTAEAKDDQGKTGEENRVSGKPVEGQSLSIATGKSAYASGEDIVVSMCLEEREPHVCGRSAGV